MLRVVNIFKFGEVVGLGGIQLVITSMVDTQTTFVERLGNIIAGFTKIITEEICVLKMMMGEYKRRLFSIFFSKFCLHSIFYVFIWLPLKLFFNNIC